MFADFGEWKSGLTCYYEGEVLNTCRLCEGYV